MKNKFKIVAWIKGDKEEQEKEDDQEIQAQRPPHPREHQSVKRDHPVDMILGDIQKGVTTHSRIARFMKTTILCLLLSLSGLRTH
jgi:hypothetical protein